MLTALEPGVWNAGVPITVVPVASVDALGRVASTHRSSLSWLPLDSPRRSTSSRPTAHDPNGGGPACSLPASASAEDPATGAAAVAAAGLLATVAVDGEARWLIEQGVEMGRRSRLDLSATVRLGCRPDGSARGIRRVGGGGNPAPRRLISCERVPRRG
ncbi:MAG: PhzF family phenazine biosynthesis protein [Microthrixaceae bacterium]